MGSALAPSAVAVADGAAAVEQAVEDLYSVYCVELDKKKIPLVKLGADAGVPTPLTARVVTLIQEIERGIRPLSRDNLAALAS